MKKLLYILVVGFFVSGSSLAVSAPSGRSAAYKASNASTAKAVKKCQRCRQGKDNRMECVQVECPK